MKHPARADSLGHALHFVELIAVLTRLFNFADFFINPTPVIRVVNGTANAPAVVYHLRDNWREWLHRDEVRTEADWAAAIEIRATNERRQKTVAPRCVVALVIESGTQNG